jgi:hypothetical protein
MQNDRSAKRQISQTTDQPDDRSARRSIRKRMLKKDGPITGATFQEATDWWVMSGKALDSVPPAGTVREVTRRKSEGHGA